MPRKSRQGEAVGKALFLSFLNDYEHRDDPGYAPLYTQERFNQMVQELNTEDDQRTYAWYVELYNAVIEEFNRAQGIYQQAQNGQSRLRGYLDELRLASHARQALDSAPYVMTQSAYDARRQALRARAVPPELLPLHALDWYWPVSPGQPGAAEKNIPPAIRRAIEDTRGHMAGDMLSLEAWKQSNPHGERTRAGGGPQDDAILQAALRPYLGEEAQLAPPDALMNGEAWPDRAYLWSLLRAEIPQKSAARAAAPPPSGWDILGAEHNARAWYREHPDAFARDFPQLWAALSQDAQDRLGLLFGKALTVGELADLSLYGFARLATPSEPGSIGVAILQGDGYPRQLFDEDGGYRALRDSLLSMLHDLQTLQGEPELQEDIRQARETLLLPALRALYAYNAALEMISEAIALPELNRLAMDCLPLMEEVRQDNLRVLSLHAAGSGQMDGADKTALLTRCFPLIRLDAPQPPARALASARAKVLDGQAFRGSMLQRQIIALAKPGKGKEE